MVPGESPAVAVWTPSFSHRASKIRCAREPTKRAGQRDEWGRIGMTVASKVAAAYTSAKHVPLRTVRDCRADRALGPVHRLGRLDATVVLRVGATPSAWSPAIPPTDSVPTNGSDNRSSPPEAPATPAKSADAGPTEGRAAKWRA